VKIIKKIGAAADEVFAEYYFLLLTCLGIFLIINYVRVDYVLANSWSGWSVGDWVINYDLGFVRRGLSGEIIRGISNLLNIKINWSTYFIQCFIYISFILLFLYRLKNKKINFWFFLLCFTPGFLLFTYYDGMAVGRKEIAIYALFAIWLNFISNNKINITISLVVACALFLLTLIHEVFFFYSLYFYMAVCLSESGSREKLNAAVVIPLASAVALLITYLYAKTLDGSLICADLLSHGLNKNICEGVIGYGNVNPAIEIQKYITNFNFNKIKDIIVVIGTVIIPNLLYLASVNASNYSKRKFILWNIFLILISSPLFIIAIDWGRWISMHITLSIMSLTIFLERKSKRSNTSSELFIFREKFIYLLIALVIFIVFTTFYSIQHCCDNGFINLFGPIIKIATTFGLIR
jgi:hypothetical protein